MKRTNYLNGSISCGTVCEVSARYDTAIESIFVNWTWTWNISSGFDSTKLVWTWISWFNGEMCSLSHSLHSTFVWIGYARFRSENQRRESDQMHANFEAHVLRLIVEKRILPQRSWIQKLRRSPSLERRRSSKVTFPLTSNSTVCVDFDSKFHSREVLQLRAEIRSSCEVRNALKFVNALNSCNYVRFFKLARLNQDYLQSCLLQRYFSQIRGQAFKIMVQAYGPPKMGHVSQHSSTLLRSCSICNIWIFFPDTLEEFDCHSRLRRWTGSSFVVPVLRIAYWFFEKDCQIRSIQFRRRSGKNPLHETVVDHRKQKKDTRQRMHCQRLGTWRSDCKPCTVQ